MLCPSITAHRLQSLLARLACAAMLALAAAGHATAADPAGQADLDKATEMKIAIANPRDVKKLGEVIELLDTAIEKGLDEANAEFAQQMLISSLLERGTARAEALLKRPVADPRRDPRWVKTRQVALSDLQRAVEFDDSLTEAYFLIGRLQMLPLGDEGAARRALTKVIQADAETISTEQLAQAYALRGATQSDPEKQAADYAKSVELVPDKAEYLLLQAQNLIRQDDYEGALAATDEAIKVAPGEHKVYVLRGHVFRAMEKAEEAIAAFEKATEIAPKVVGPYQYRGELYSILGDKEKAIEELTKAIEMAPGNLASPLIRAELYSATEQYQEALDDVESVLRRQPGLVRAHLMRTSLLGRLDRDEEAVAILEKLAEAAPDQAEIQLQLSGYYMDAGRAEDAIGALTKVVEISGDSPVALRMRGDMYLSSGKHREALDDFAKAYDLSPEDSGLLNNFAWTLATSPFGELRDGDRAVELATKACELTEYKAAHILSTLAAAYAESGDFEKAIEFSQKAVEQHAADEEATRDMTADLAAELASYQSGQPWRELQEAGAAPVEEPAESDEPAEEPAAPLLDF